MNTENQNIEFKESWRDEYLKWICGFANAHRSLPHNPDIANTFFRAGFIESWGRGIEKICTLCKNYGILEPEYTVHPGDIMLKFLATTSGQASGQTSGQTELNTAEKSSLKSSLKSETSIIEAIKVNPNVTIPILQDITGMSRNGIKKALNRLREQGIIRRVGPDKGGHWEIIKEV